MPLRSRPLVPISVLGLLGVLMVALVSLGACAGLGRAFEKPRIHVVGVDVQSVSLDSADLIFDFSVENPNSLALVLNGVGYRLRVNGEPFLDGRSDQRTELAARGTGRVQLPMKLRFADVMRVLQSLEGERTAGYELRADFRFSVPVVGELTVPVSQRGTVPLDRIRIR